IELPFHVASGWSRAPCQRPPSVPIRVRTEYGLRQTRRFGGSSALSSPRIGYKIANRPLGERLFSPISYPFGISPLDSTAAVACDASSARSMRPSKRQSAKTKITAFTSSFSQPAKYMPRREFYAFDINAQLSTVCSSLSHIACLPRRVTRHGREHSTTTKCVNLCLTSFRAFPYHPLLT